MMKTRYLELPTHATTIQLEPIFWDALDTASAGNWKGWVLTFLREKPKDVNRSSWIRQRIMKLYMHQNLP